VISNESKGSRNIQHKIPKHSGTIDKLDDLEIGFDPRPITKKEQKMISAYIKKDKIKHLGIKISTNA
jgi:hypothetical protein